LTYPRGGKRRKRPLLSHSDGVFGRERNEGKRLQRKKGRTRPAVRYIFSVILNNRSKMGSRNSNPGVSHLNYS